MASARPILVDAGALQNSPQYFMAVLVLDTLSWSLTSFPFLQRAAAPLLPLVFRTSTSPFTSPLRPEENQGQGSLGAPIGDQWRQKNHLLRPPGFIFSPTIDSYSSSTCGPLRTHQSIQHEFKTCRSRTPSKRKSFLDQKLKCRSGIVYNTFFWSDLLFSLDIKCTQKESLLRWLSLLNRSRICIICTKK